MKKILLVGKNSYIGNSLIKWLITYQEGYFTDVITARNTEWKTVDFGKYDTIIDVSGICHVKIKQEIKKWNYTIMK